MGDRAGSSPASGTTFLQNKPLRDENPGKGFGKTGVFPAFQKGYIGGFLRISLCQIPLIPPLLKGEQLQTESHPLTNILFLIYLFSAPPPIFFLA